MSGQNAELSLNCTTLHRWKPHRHGSKITPVTIRRNEQNGQNEFRMVYAYAGMWICESQPSAGGYLVLNHHESEVSP